MIINIDNFIIKEWAYHSGNKNKVDYWERLVISPPNSMQYFDYEDIFRTSIKILIGEENCVNTIAHWYKNGFENIAKMIWQFIPFFDASFNFSKIDIVKNEVDNVLPKIAKLKAFI